MRNLAALVAFSLTLAFASPASSKPEPKFDAKVTYNRVTQGKVVGSIENVEALFVEAKDKTPAKWLLRSGSVEKSEGIINKPRVGEQVVDKDKTVWTITLVTTGKGHFACEVKKP